MFSSYFIKNFGEYNQRALAALSNEASYDMSAKILQVRDDIGQKLSDDHKQMKLQRNIMKYAENKNYDIGS